METVVTENPLSPATSRMVTIYPPRTIRATICCKTTVHEFKQNRHDCTTSLFLQHQQLTVKRKKSKFTSIVTFHRRKCLPDYGKQIRLKRILHQERTTLVVAFDHALV